MNLTRVFFDIDMRQAFEGLRDVAKTAKSKSGPDTKLLFLNRRMTAFKIIIDDVYLVYYKNGSRRIPLDALKFLPTKFGGSEMEMNNAIRKSLRDKLNIDMT